MPKDHKEAYFFTKRALCRGGGEKGTPYPAEIRKPVIVISKGMTRFQKLKAGKKDARSCCHREGKRDISP